MAKVTSDRWLFMAYYPIAAIAAVHIGNDRTLLELSHTPSYYSDLLLAFGLSYAVGLYLRRIFFTTTSLHSSRSTRLQAHLYKGILGPVLGIIFTEMAYLYFIDIPLNESPMFYLEIPIAILLVGMANLFYFIQFVEYQQHLHKPTKIPIESSYRTQLLGSQGIHTFNIATNTISFIEYHERCTFLFTVYGQRYTLTQGIQTMAKQLNPNDFFLLNRQVLAHRQGIVSFENTTTRKLKILLSPRSLDEVYVSKEKAPAFTKWLHNEVHLPSVSQLNMSASNT